MTNISQLFSLTSARLYLLCVLVALPSCASNLAKLDFIVADDKIKHLSATIGISAATAAYYRRDRNKNRCNAAAMGFGISMSIGAGKEIYDKQVKKTRWDWDDMVWNFIGSSVGSILGSGCH